jgi:hypothetical protein
MSFMSALPSNRPEWLSLISFPFKAYSVIAPVFFLLWNHLPADHRQSGLRAAYANCIGSGYVICFLFFFFAAVVQLLANKPGPLYTAFCMQSPFLSFCSYGRCSAEYDCVAQLRRRENCRSVPPPGRHIIRLRQGSGGTGLTCGSASGGSGQINGGNVHVWSLRACVMQFDPLCLQARHALFPHPSKRLPKQPERFAFASGILFNQLVVNADRFCI